jgi:hypothetical protein
MRSAPQAGVFLVPPEGRIWHLEGLPRVSSTRSTCFISMPYGTRLALRTIATIANRVISLFLLGLKNTH